MCSSQLNWRALKPSCQNLNANELYYPTVVKSVSTHISDVIPQTCKLTKLNATLKDPLKYMACKMLSITGRIEHPFPNRWFFSPLDLKILWWPQKTSGHLFYTALSFVDHFQSIGEFKLELQSGNPQFGPKLVIFCPVWPWNLMDDLEKQ